MEKNTFFDSKEIKEEVQNKQIESDLKNKSKYLDILYDLKIKEVNLKEKLNELENEEKFLNDEKIKKQLLVNKQELADTELDLLKITQKIARIYNENKLEPYTFDEIEAKKSELETENIIKTKNIEYIKNGTGLYKVKEIVNKEITFIKDEIKNKEVEISNLEQKNKEIQNKIKENSEISELGEIKDTDLDELSEAEKDIYAENIHEINNLNNLRKKLSADYNLNIIKIRNLKSEIERLENTINQ
ncbi:MAG: hypothetical protein NT068_00670 [Candidatus Nomurabacteria bacterium]|nr:hypothetical protein [Candidatus Nomurabacteria bacterium]